MAPVQPVRLTCPISALGNPVLSTKRPDSLCCAEYLFRFERMGVPIRLRGLKGWVLRWTPPSLLTWCASKIDVVVDINPREESTMNKITLVGIDLAKRCYQICALDERGTVVYNRRFTAAKFALAMQQLPATTIAMEACAAAHYWGRRLQALGHQVRLIPPQHAKAFGNMGWNMGSVTIENHSSQPSRAMAVGRCVRAAGNRSRQRTQPSLRAKPLAEKGRKSDCIVARERQGSSCQCLICDSFVY